MKKSKFTSDAKLPVTDPATQRARDRQRLAELLGGLILNHWQKHRTTEEQSADSENRSEPQPNGEE